MVRRKNDRKHFPMSSAGSQGEGGPGEMELSVADATAAFEMVLSPGAGRASAARGQAPPADTTAAGQAGDHPPAPPAGDVDGRDSQCRPGKPPAGHLLGKGYKRRVGSGVGMQGAKPLA